jgi:cysteine synthase
VITAAVGRTPLVEPTRVVPPGAARVLVKVEGQNPTGSMKDRMALAVIDGAAVAREPGALVRSELEYPIGFLLPLEVG